MVGGQSPVIGHKTLSDKPQISQGAITTEGVKFSCSPFLNQHWRLTWDLRKGVGWQVLFLISHYSLLCNTKTDAKIPQWYPHTIKELTKVTNQRWLGQSHPDRSLPSAGHNDDNSDERGRKRSLRIREKSWLLRPRPHKHKGGRFTQELTEESVDVRVYHRQTYIVFNELWEKPLNAP